jgi:hypothetical protein
MCMTIRTINGNATGVIQGAMINERNEAISERNLY